MGKLILFTIQAGSFQTGFYLTLQICEDSCDRIAHPFATFTGKLPPCQPIRQHYQQWQESYRSLNQKVRLGSSPQQITHISNSCRQSASQLKETLSNWYNSSFPDFARVRENLLSELNRDESVRLLIQTEISELIFLPWHLFFEPFLSKYPQAEIAIAPIEYKSLNTPQKQRQNIRILAVLGNDEGINLKPDLETLNNLEKAEIKTLINPCRKELFAHLYEEEWDLFFFAGHSGKNPLTQQGQLYLNQEDIITIEEFNKAIMKSIQKGLRLAIFNSCDGLGLAKDLAALHLPQTIVMGEMIPDKVAHVFIKEFLANFAQNQTLYLAVRQARERLQELENEYPCATWLPIICQNPASLPLTWQNLQGLDFAPISIKTIKPPENFQHLVLETLINQTQLIIEYESLTETNTEVIVNYIDKDLSFAEDINRIISEAGGKNINRELKQEQVKNLGQILITNGGQLRADKIFHAVIYDYHNHSLTDRNLISTVISRCLNLSDSSGRNSIAFPFLSPVNSTVEVDEIGLIFAQEIVKYLEGNTKLNSVKIILQNYNQNKNITDEKLYRFYLSFKQYIELKKEINHRQSLLSDLVKIYQKRSMSSAVEILHLYQDSLNRFETEWINNRWKEKQENNSYDYQLPLENITQQINSQKSVVINEEIVTSLHQNYHEKAATIWQDLVNLEDEDEIIILLRKLGLDIDGFAWINDQYEIAIASVKARQKKVNEMLKNQVQQLEKGQELLQKTLVNLYQEGSLNKKEEGEERRLLFREYPKVDIKVKTEELPEEYRLEKISYSADKKALKEAIERGEDLSNYAKIDPNLKAQFGFK
ncbi:macro domain-containing protein [Cyanobacterium aponinum]|uniref:CHAT domain-containing protein n=1 Tax=Cyanobacterium aponinum 0216 TaxID=2676140 RepID=A0A844GNY7_9CHRO|nr:macro domain-containing protein [Cyanobacterium aponinum]MTF38187.1 CHAT domain-containing protein [Cyanobacterium aponinum 0216]